MFKKNYDQIKDKFEFLGAKFLIPSSALLVFLVGVFIGYVFGIFLQIVIAALVAWAYVYTRNFKGIGILVLFSVLLSGAGLIVGNILDLII